MVWHYFGRMMNKSKFTITLMLTSQLGLLTMIIGIFGFSLALMGSQTLIE